MSFAATGMGFIDCYTEWSTSDGERQISYAIAYMWNPPKAKTNEPIYKSEIDEQPFQNKPVFTKGEGGEEIY